MGRAFPESAFAPVPLYHYVAKRDQVLQIPLARKRALIVSTQIIVKRTIYAPDRSGNPLRSKDCSVEPEMAP